MKILVSSCDISRTYDLTFFIASSTNDILTCGTNSPVNAVIISHIINDFLALPSIWDTYTSTSPYHCLITKTFLFQADQQVHWLMFFQMISLL